MLVLGGPLGIGALAEAEQVSLPTMSKVVSALEGAGLVERVPGERDRRSVSVRPTPAGREVVRAGRERRVRRIAAQLSELPEADLRTLDRAAAILAHLEGT